MPEAQSAQQNNSHFVDKMEASDLILPMLVRNLLFILISSPELFKISWQLWRESKQSLGQNSLKTSLFLPKTIVLGV